jgi:hypothetical protein
MLDQPWLPYVLFALGGGSQVFMLAYGLVSDLRDRAFKRGWNAACEAAGIDSDSLKKTLVATCGVSPEAIEITIRG